MKALILILLVLPALSAAPDKQTFTGTITDNMCDKAGHPKCEWGRRTPRARFPV